MDGPCWFLVVLILFTLGSGVCGHECATSRCAPGGPDIRFPFRKKDQPAHCGFPGFELSCVGNETQIELPLAGRLTLTSISYDTQMLRLDPRSCPPVTFLNLNLSNSPFESDESQNIYMLLNCSSELPIAVPYLSPYYYNSYNEIQCLSVFRHRLFAVRRNYIDDLDERCESVKTEPVPWTLISNLCDEGAYSPSLSWEIPDCRACEARRVSCRLKSMTTQETTCSISGRWTRRKTIGVCIVGSILILALAATVKPYRSWKLKRSQSVENERKIEKFLKEYKSLNPMRYSYADIKKITDQFKTKLGEGGYGSVFKGLLPNGIYVAVKILKCVGNNGEEFVNEVCTIGRIHHVNIVRLLGFCADGVKRALIYEFMPNESLEKFIFSQDGENPSLGWAKLHDIASGIARGIEYLHQGCEQRILHFDIKPHNILLDHKLNPKISDFGLAKLCSKEQSIVSMTVARGTVGYIAPEVVSRNCGNVSHKSDVYSFGMLLLEMVGGRKNVDATVDNTSQIYFPEWIYGQLHQGSELQLSITNEEDDNTAKLLAITALWCIQWYPVDRPAMNSVVQMLEGSVESLTIPPNPFASAAPPNSDPVFKTMIRSTNLTAISESDTELAIEISDT
uniref:Putative receptor-like protein kinase At5g39020 n=1 Tax=Anthurium amnicola TaxID=1678845 RepID=A0A1D1XTV1_9ARAE